MGKKAKLKKAREQQTTDKTEPKYDSTQFVEQFKHLGYKLPSKKKFDSSDHALLLFAPEIPQDKIEPQL